MTEGGILLTGFEPFEGARVNPSWEVAQALDGERIVDALVQSERLPCVFGEASRQLEALLIKRRPTLVLCLGLAGGRAAVTVERVAINVDDARIPDNAGRKPEDVPIVPDGPAAYFSTLPVKAIVQALRGVGIPAAVSDSAGTFVCNHVFYALMHHLVRRLSGSRGGFIHLPYLPEQTLERPELPSMALTMQVDAVRLALGVARGGGGRG